MRAVSRAISLVCACLVEAVDAATGGQSIRGHALAVGRWVSFAAPIILSLAALVYIPVAHASCRLEEIAVFHVEMVGNSPIVNGQINGQPIRILLDTGSSVSFITRTAARQLDLSIRSYTNRGGLSSAMVKELKIGQFVFKNYPANVASTSITEANGVASFQMGADLFSQFTTEWDLAHGIVRLLHPRDCKLEQLAYWSPSYFQVNLERMSLFEVLVVFEIKINGRATKAKLDSGSAFSYLTPTAAREAGVEPGSPDAQPADEISGLTEKPIPTWIGRFDTFEVGGEMIKNARLRIGEFFPPWGNRVNINLGADFLQANHLIIVPEKHTALFTYNGGAVFQRERPD
jgi:hypothetical protein